MTAASVVAHGYTMRDLDHFVHIGITRNAWYNACDREERYAAGWHAAVELLYTTDEPPTPQDLIRAAWYTADNLTCRTAEERGIPRPRGDAYAGRIDMPRWHAYWETICRHTGSPEEFVVERTALEQIWPQLTPGQQAALQALAVHDSYESAAAALGLNYQAFFQQVAKARRRFLALWWEGETPRRGWRDRRRSTAETQLHSVSAHIRKRRRAGIAA